MWGYEGELRALARKQIEYGRGTGRRPVLFYGGSSFRFWDRSDHSSFEGPYLGKALGVG